MNIVERIYEGSLMGAIKIHFGLLKNHISLSRKSHVNIFLRWYHSNVCSLRNNLVHRMTCTGGGGGGAVAVVNMRKYVRKLSTKLFGFTKSKYNGEETWKLAKPTLKRMC